MINQHTHVSFSGIKFYFKDKEMKLLHRTDGPAIEWEKNGYEEWWVNGELHREDGPAIEYPVGSKSWYKNGKLHREDGPAVEWEDGRKYWFVDGKLLYKEDQSEVVGESRLSKNNTLR